MDSDSLPHVYLFTGEHTKLQYSFSTSKQDELGRGGQGIVYRGKCIDHDYTVAIKVVHSKKLEDKLFARNFWREVARLKKNLTHDNVAKFIDMAHVGEDYYLVYEYCNGEPLSHKIKAGMSMDEIKHIFRGIVKGVDFLHKNEIIHRDLKPQNIMLTIDPKTQEIVPKIIDLGLARDECNNLEMTVLGTPLYMAPEQWKKEYDFAVDIYALGAMLYEMIERKTLYQECVRRECVRDKCPDASKFFNQFPLNNEAAELIKYMTQWNPQSRLNTMEILKDPFLSKKVATFILHIGCTESLYLVDTNEYSNESLMKYIVQGIKDVLRKKIKDCSGDLILLAASRSWEVIGPLALHLDDFMQADRRIIVLLDSRKNHEKEILECIKSPNQEIDEKALHKNATTCLRISLALQKFIEDTMRETDLYNQNLRSKSEEICTLMENVLGAVVTDSLRGFSTVCIDAFNNTSQTLVHDLNDTLQHYTANLEKELSSRTHSQLNPITISSKIHQISNVAYILLKILNLLTEQQKSIDNQHSRVCNVLPSVGPSLQQHADLGELDRLKTDNDCQAQAIVALETELQNKSQELDETKRLNCELSDTVNKQQADIQALRNEIEQLKRELKESRDMEAQVRQDLDVAIVEKEQCVEQLSQATGTIAELTQERNELVDMLNDAQLKNVDLQAKNENLTRMLSNFTVVFVKSRTGYYHSLIPGNATHNPKIYLVLDRNCKFDEEDMITCMLLSIPDVSEPKFAEEENEYGLPPNSLYVDHIWVALPDYVM